MSLFLFLSCRNTDLGELLFIIPVRVGRIGEAMVAGKWMRTDKATHTKEG